MYKRQMKDNRDEMYMRQALREAEEAFAIGEVPIGAVLVLDVYKRQDLRKADYCACFSLAQRSMVAGT